MVSISFEPEVKLGEKGRKKSDDSVYGCNEKDPQNKDLPPPNGDGTSESLRQLDNLNPVSLTQGRGSQLCVPASQQVCLYRCNRTEKSKLPRRILPWPNSFVKF
jgi:hypothetical protein